MATAPSPTIRACSASSTGSPCSRPAPTRSGSSGSPRCSTGSAIPSAAAAGPPRRRHQRQGLDLRLPSRRDRGGGAQGACLYQPAPRPLQRADPHRRAADRRRTRSPTCSRRCSTPPTGSSRASSRRPPPPPSSLSPARRPTPASSRSGSAAGSTRPTSSPRRPSCGIAQLGLDHQQFLGDRIEDVAAEKAGIAKRGRAARHARIIPTGWPADRRAGAGGGRALAAARRRVGCRRLPRTSSIIATRRGGSSCRCRASPAPHQATERRPRRRHDPPPAGCRGRRAGAARGDGLGGMAGAAAEARARAAPRPAAARIGAVARRRPQSRRRPRRRRHLPRHVPAGRPFHIVFGLLANKDCAGRARGRSRTAPRPPRGAGAGPSAPPARRARRRRARRRPRRAGRGRSRRRRSAGSPATPTAHAPPIVLVMGSLYLAGEVLRGERAGADDSVAAPRIG